MSPYTQNLALALCAAAVGQGLIALINLFLVRLLHWERDVERMPLLVRQVFHVHGWFISVILVTFATLTWRFADDFAIGCNPLAAWLAGCIAAFWGLRTVMQVAYYSREHWRGQPVRILIHVILLLVYGGFTATYALAAMR